MKWVVYVLQSLHHRRYYVGSTSDINRRVGQHNSGKVSSTKRGIPWKVVFREEAHNRQIAYKRELQIKSYKGGQAFKRLLKK